MNTTNNTIQVRAVLRDFRAAYDSGLWDGDRTPADFACEFLNATGAELDAEGDLWTGRQWADDALLADFVTWLLWQKALPPQWVSDKRIEALRDEAGAAGDSAMMDACSAALQGDEDARSECFRVMLRAAVSDTPDDEIHCTVGQLCRFYGVEMPPNTDPEMGLVVSRSPGGRWRVSGVDAEWGGVDAEWAPTSDEQAGELRREVESGAQKEADAAWREIVVTIGRDEKGAARMALHYDRQVAGGRWPEPACPTCRVLFSAWLSWAHDWLCEEGDDR
jgi:hypothetical protein